MIAGSHGKSVWSFVKKTVKQSSKVAVHHFTVPSAMNESSFCFTCSSAFGTISVLDFGHSTMCVMVSHCFHLHFLDGIWYKTSFHMLICHLYNIHFVELSVKVFGPFINWIFFSYCWVLRVPIIFWRRVLNQMCLLQIFSPNLCLTF